MLSSNCPLFAMQLLVSAVGMGLSVVMLAMGRDPAVYLPVVTSIVGYWLPAPKRPDPPASAWLLQPEESNGSVAPMVPQQSQENFGGMVHGHAAAVNDTANDTVADRAADAAAHDAAAHDAAARQNGRAAAHADAASADRAAPARTERGAAGYAAAAGYNGGFNGSAF